MCAVVTMDGVKRLHRDRFASAHGDLGWFNRFRYQDAATVGGFGAELEERKRDDQYLGVESVIES